MDGDPWAWGVAEVLLFFRHHAHLLLVDRPTVTLPQVTAFTQALEAQQIDGVALLQFVDMQNLKDDFGVLVFAERTAVMQCIIKLRNRSPAWRYQTEPPSSRVLTVTPALTPMIPPAVLQNNTSTPTQTLMDPPVHVTPDLYATIGSANHEQPSRKRRRVEVVSVPLSEQRSGNIGKITKPQHDTLSSYLPQSKMTVDEQFFGHYRFGEQIGEFADPPELSHGTEEGVESWQFRPSGNLQGSVGVVHGRIKHFMCEGWSDLERFGRIDHFVLPALGSAPQKQSRRGNDTITLDATTSSSALVVRTDNLVAVREKAALLEMDYDYAKEADIDDLNHNTHGDLLLNYQLDSLLYRHHHDRSTYELEIDMSLETPVAAAGSDQNQDESEPVHGLEDDDAAEFDDDASSGSDMASVEDAIGVGEEEMAATLDRYIEDFVATWRTDKLPQLQEKKAFTEWSKMKKSRLLRDTLIERERKKITSFNSRLREMREAFLEDRYSTVDDLRRCCAIMDVTIEQREESRWRISIYQNAKQPHRTIRRGKPTQQAYGKSNGAFSSLEVDENDRLSFLPTTPTHVNATHDDDDTSMKDAADTDPGDGNEAADERSDSRDTEDLIDDDTGVIDLTNFESSPVRPLSTSTPKLQLTPVNHKVESDSDDLPSPSQFDFGPKRAESSNIAKSTLADPIILSSDDSSDLSLPPSRRRNRGKAAIHNVDAMDAEPSAIDAWDFKQLKKDQNRIGLLIKLLSKISHNHREQILQMAGRDSKALSAHVEVIRATLGMLADCAESGNDRELEDADDNADIVQARVVLAWYLLDDTMVFSELKDVLARKHVLETVKENNDQLRQFAALVQKVSYKKSTLFKDAPKPKKRVRPLKALDEAGVRRRQAAKARQTQAISQSLSNDAGLQDMIASERIVVNPSSESPIFIAPGIARTIKPHQIEGIQFMWRELTSCAPNNPDADPPEEVAEYQEGCILAHTMGLGKTCQAIALLIAICDASVADQPEIFHQLPEVLRPQELRTEGRRLRMLVLCPVNLIPNWEREILLWDLEACLGIVYKEQATSGRTSRGEELSQWIKNGGVLLMGYDFFTKLAGDSDQEDDVSVTDNSHVSLDGDEGSAEERISKPKKKRNRCIETLVEKAKAQEVRRCLRECPEIVVADEAHYLKNEKNNRSHAAAKIQTRARIGLTGTPMSNDVDEVYSVVSWVAPGYLGPKDEFATRYGRPIRDGNGIDAHPSEVRASRKALRLLKEEIESKVHRADITVLKGELPPKVEFYVKLALCEEQEALYRKILEPMIATKTGETSTVQIFSWLAVLGVLTTHPALFKKKLQNVAVKDGRKFGILEAEVNAIADAISDDADPNRSAKTAILLEILRLSRASGDKVLVFSHRLPTLAYLETLLTSKGIEHRKIQGEGMSPRQREEALAAFQRPSDGVEVLLISTDSGSTGYNMQVANRVIIFDSSFNPMVEKQAVGRAYRTLQQKPVFVYRLLAAGTFETNMDNMQNFKMSLTDRVIDSRNVRSRATKNPGKWLFPPRATQQEDLTQWVGKDPQVMDHILDRIGRPDALPIREMITMETLQQEDVVLPFTAEEEHEVEQERQAIRNGRLKKNLKGHHPAERV